MHSSCLSLALILSSLSALSLAHKVDVVVEALAEEDATRRVLTEEQVEGQVEVVVDEPLSESDIEREVKGKGDRDCRYIGSTKQGGACNGQNGYTGIKCTGSENDFTRRKPSGLKIPQDARDGRFVYDLSGMTAKAIVLKGHYEAVLEVTIPTADGLEDVVYIGDIPNTQGQDSLDCNECTEPFQLTLDRGDPVNIPRNVNLELTYKVRPRGQEGQAICLNEDDNYLALHKIIFTFTKADVVTCQQLQVLVDVQGNLDAKRERDDNKQIVGEFVLVDADIVTANGQLIQDVNGRRCAHNGDDKTVNVGNECEKTIRCFSSGNRFSRVPEDTKAIKLRMRLDPSDDVSTTMCPKDSMKLPGYEGGDYTFAAHVELRDRKQPQETVASLTRSCSEDACTISFTFDIVCKPPGAVFALSDDSSEVKFGFQGDAYVRREDEGDLSLRAAIGNEVVIKSPLDFRIKAVDQATASTMCDSLGDQGKTLLFTSEDSSDELHVCLEKGGRFQWVKIDTQRSIEDELDE